MKRIKKKKNDEMRAEYDLGKGECGKYAKAMQQGYSVRVLKADGTVDTRQFVPKENTVVLDPDVKPYFPDSESVNDTLRSLINLIPEKKAGRVAEKRGRYGKK